MTQAIYRLKTENFRFFDLTQQTPQARSAEMRKMVQEEVEKSFNNMDTMLNELRRIAEYQGKNRGF